MSDQILEQAADWLFRLHDAPNDPGLRRALDAWIAADPRHAEAWRAAEKSWVGTGLVAPVFVAPALIAKQPAGRAAKPQPATIRFPSRRRPRLAGLAMAAGLAALALLSALPDGPLGGLKADHRTGTAQTLPVDLADGSRMTLDAGAAASARFDVNGRAVDLYAGEAFFAVTPDPARPFVVRGGDLTVTVTGTAFNVALTKTAATVSVAEGSVAVAYRGGKERLSPGQSLLIDRPTGAVRRRAVDPADVAAWRGKRLVAGDQPFASVVETIGRHYAGFILTTGDVLDNKRVTGVYDLSDPERALQALVGPYGGAVRRITPYLLVVSPP